MKKFFLLTFLYLLIINIRVFAQVTFTGAELLGRPTDHSITLNVVSSSALDAYVEYGTSSASPDNYSYTTSIVSKAANEPIEILIDGLTVDTKYYYRLRYRVNGSGGTFSARDEYSFYTQRLPGSTFSFTIIADSHLGQLGSATNYNYATLNVAEEKPDLHLDLGDTFITDGLTTQAQVDQKYLNQRPYFGNFSHSTSVFLSPGNHENEEGWNFDDTPPLPILNINARKIYYPTPFPDDFYSGNSDISETRIDGDHLRLDYYAWVWGDVLFVFIDPFQYTMNLPYTPIAGEGNEPVTGNQWSWTLGKQQYDWLKQTLENSDAKYKFIFSHHVTGGQLNVSVGAGGPGYVRGGANAAPYFEWGGKNADGSWGFDTYRPGWGVDQNHPNGTPIHQLMIDNGVSAYFHGHDHEYAYEKVDKIVYQEVPSPSITGTGFGLYHESDSNTLKVLSGPGHLLVTVTPDSAIVDYVSSGNTSNDQVVYSYAIHPPSVNVNAKVFLEGPYAGSGTMNTALTVPTTDPYGQGETVGSIPSGVVDWVKLELRKESTPGIVAATRAAFLKSNGSIVDLDGTSPVKMFGVTDGNYYIVVKQRNHLAIMSHDAQALSSSTSTLYDFTTGSDKFYGDDLGAKDLGSGVWGMIAGDGNGNGQIQNDDSENIWKPDNGTSGYKNADYNMNGQVQNDDNENYWKINNGRGSQVP